MEKQIQNLNLKDVELRNFLQKKATLSEIIRQFFRLINELTKLDFERFNNLNTNKLEIIEKELLIIKDLKVIFKFIKKNKLQFITFLKRYETIYDKVIIKEFNRSLIDLDEQLSSKFPFVSSETKLEKELKEAKQLLSIPGEQKQNYVVPHSVLKFVIKASLFLILFTPLSAQAAQMVEGIDIEKNSSKVLQIAEKFGLDNLGDLYNTPEYDKLDEKLKQMSHLLYEANKYLKENPVIGVSSSETKSINGKTYEVKANTFEG